MIVSKWSLAWNQLSQFLIFKIQENFCIRNSLHGTNFTPEIDAHTYTHIKMSARTHKNQWQNNTFGQSEERRCCWFFFPEISLGYRELLRNSIHIVQCAYMHPIVMAWASGRMQTMMENWCNIFFYFFFFHFLRLCYCFPFFTVVKLLCVPFPIFVCTKIEISYKMQVYSHSIIFCFVAAVTAFFLFATSLAKCVRLRFCCFQCWHYISS